jgi:hypothetical protein
MGPEQQRIAIAEACGWNHWFNGWNKLDDNTPPLVLTEDLPDYLNDLNAMHEAEKMLEGGRTWNRYTDELGKACYYNPSVHCLRSLANIIVSATAAQRAEAFLRTLNLWVS